MKKKFSEMMEWFGAYSVVGIAVVLPFIGLLLLSLAMFGWLMGAFFY